VYDDGGWRTVAQRTTGNQKDITTFFFSKFPDAFSKMDLWRVFQLWAWVCEVFIAEKKNYWGVLYDFVQFLDVKNE